MEGIVIRGVGGLYTVASPEGIFDCRGRGGLKQNKNILYVGDRVDFLPEGVITSIHPRTNVLPRPPVANVDKLFIVVACADPAPNYYMLDKLTVLAEHCGVRPVLVLNKPDLGDPSVAAQRFSAAGYPCYVLNARAGENASALINEISGYVCAFAGASGVGKSTLMNALAPELERQTGAVSAKLQRGRHTTRTVELFSVAGGYLADTPGFSELDFALCGLRDREKLADYFPEFSSYLGNCEFRDCIHGKERGCAVRAAAEEGKIPLSRYENYRRMYEEIGPLRFWEVSG